MATVQIIGGGQLDGWPTGLGDGDDNGDEAAYETEAALVGAQLHLIARRHPSFPGSSTKIYRTAAQIFNLAVAIESYSKNCRLVAVYSTDNVDDEIEIELVTPYETVTRSYSGTANGERRTLLLDAQLEDGAANDFTGAVAALTLTLTPSNPNSGLTAGLTLWSWRILVYPMDEIEV